jgi:hypothetical protein
VLVIRQVSSSFLACNEKGGSTYKYTECLTPPPGLALGDASPTTEVKSYVIEGWLGGDFHRPHIGPEKLGHANMPSGTRMTLNLSG